MMLGLVTRVRTCFFNLPNNWAGVRDLLAEATSAPSGIFSMSHNCEGILQVPAAKTDITLEVREGVHNLLLHLEYNTDIFNSSTASRMLNSFWALLHKVVQDCNLSISHYSLIDSDEQARILGEWCSSHVDFPESCVHHLIAQQVALMPHHPAVVFHNGKLRITYKELNDRASWIAHKLSLIAAQPESVVGIYSRQDSWETLAFVLAVWKCGRAYVPLDIQLPMERLAYIIKDSKTSVILCQGELEDRLFSGEHGVKLLRFKATTPSTVGQSDDVVRVVMAYNYEEWTVQHPNTLQEGTPNSLAYVIYTSGSSGLPKGVAVEHISLVNTAYQCAKVMGLGTFIISINNHNTTFVRKQ